MPEIHDLGGDICKDIQERDIVEKMWEIGNAVHWEMSETAAYDNFIRGVDGGPNSRDAVREYQSDSESVNRMLRNPAMFSHVDTSGAKQHIDMLRRVCYKNKLEEPMVVYRGVKPFGKFQPKYWQVGDIIQDKGFLSTSIHPLVGVGYGSDEASETAHNPSAVDRIRQGDIADELDWLGSPSYLMTIKLKEGTPCVTAGEVSAYEDEMEVILKDGLPLKVVDIDHKKHIVYMEVASE